MPHGTTPLISTYFTQNLSFDMVKHRWSLTQCGSNILLSFNAAMRRRKKYESQMIELWESPCLYHFALYMTCQSNCKYSDSQGNRTCTWFSYAMYIAYVLCLGSRRMRGRRTLWSQHLRTCNEHQKSSEVAKSWRKNVKTRSERRIVSLFHEIVLESAIWRLYGCFVLFECATASINVMGLAFRMSIHTSVDIGLRNWRRTGWPHSFFAENRVQKVPLEGVLLKTCPQTYTTTKMTMFLQYFLKVRRINSEGGGKSRTASSD